MGKDAQQQKTKHAHASLLLEEEKNNTRNDLE